MWSYLRQQQAWVLAQKCILCYHSHNITVCDIMWLSLCILISMRDFTLHVSHLSFVNCKKTPNYTEYVYMEPWETDRLYVMCWMPWVRAFLWSSSTFSSRPVLCLHNLDDRAWQGTCGRCEMPWHDGLRSAETSDSQRQSWPFKKPPTAKPKMMWLEPTIVLSKTSR